MIRRLRAALLAAVVLLASWTAAPAEESSPLPEGSDAFAERFGLGAYLLVWDAPPAHILYTALLSVSLMLLALGEKAAIDE